MAIEVERRFIVKNNQWKKVVTQSKNIIQGYLIAQKELSIRVRIEQTMNAEDNNILLEQFTLTIKTFISDKSRHEYEYPIPEKDAREIIEKCSHFVINKTRHLVQIDDFLFEIDEYHQDNQSLVLAEIEIPNEEIDIPHPDWLGEEVTQDGRYSNAYLSTHPFNTWSDEEKKVIHNDGASL